MHIVKQHHNFPMPYIPRSECVKKDLIMLVQSYESRYPQTPGMTNWAKWVLLEAWGRVEAWGHSMCDEQIRPIMIVALGAPWAGLDQSPSRLWS